MKLSSIEAAAYREQFIKILMQREPRFLRLALPQRISLYRELGFTESEAVDRFIASRLCRMSGSGSDPTY